MKNQTKARLYAGFAVFFWSITATVFKLTLEYISPIELVFFSSFFAFITLSFFYFSSLDPETSSKEVLHSAILGFINPFMYYLILLKAYSLFSFQAVQPLNFIWPFIIVLLSIPILKQIISTGSIISIFISFSGIIVILIKEKNINFEFDSYLGIFLAFTVAVIWVLFFILNIKNQMDGFSKLFLSIAFGLFYILIFLFQTSRFRFDKVYLAQFILEYLEWV